MNTAKLKRTNILKMNADGSNQRRLTNNPAADGDPDWEPLPSPEKGTESLIDGLNALASLNAGQSEAVLAPLNNALRQLEGDNHQAAIRSLSAFIREIDVLIHSGQFSEQEKEERLLLKTAAQQIIDQLK